MPEITRTAMTDDDGTGETGTVINQAWKTELYDQIDASLALLRDPDDDRPVLGGPTQTTVGAAGGATALPATPTGYLEVVIAGVACVMPYYAKS